MNAKLRKSLANKVERSIDRDNILVKKRGQADIFKVPDPVNIKRKRVDRGRVTVEGNLEAARSVDYVGFHTDPVSFKCGFHIMFDAKFTTSDRFKMSALEQSNGDFSQRERLETGWLCGATSFVLLYHYERTHPGVDNFKPPKRYVLPFSYILECEETARHIKIKDIPEILMIPDHGGTRATWYDVMFQTEVVAGKNQA